MKWYVEAFQTKSRAKELFEICSLKQTPGVFTDVFVIFPVRLLQGMN